MLFLLAACHPEDPVNQAPWADEDIYMADPYSLAGEPHSLSASREEAPEGTIKSLSLSCSGGLWIISAWPFERVEEAIFFMTDSHGSATGQLTSVPNVQEEHHQMFTTERPIMTQIPPGWQYAVTDIPCQPLDEKIGLVIELRDEENTWLGCTSYGVVHEQWKGRCDPIDDDVTNLY